MALKIVQRKTSDLIPYARNARTHSDTQVAQIAASIKEFGFNNPILITKGNDIIAGHGRALAASKLGLATVPCIELGHLTDTQRRAYVLADNKIALNSGWDEAMLSLELTDLEQLDFDLELLGFTLDEIDATHESATGEVEGKTDPDAIPENVETRVKAGDLWLLGDHRLLCGDSTKAEDVERLMGGEKADMVFTDPPYECDISVIDKALKNTNASQFLLMATFKQVSKISFYEGYKFHFDLVSTTKTPKSFMNHKQPYFCRQNIVYLSSDDKTIFSTKNAIGAFSEAAFYPTVIEYTKTSELHGHQKSVDLLKKILSGFKAKTLADPFIGSGSTLIACEKTGRRCYGMEIDPHYCSVILKRWEDFTGKTATRLEA